MKKFSILLALCFSIIVSFAQHVPQGMKYQAVARNTAGNIIGNQEISLKINLVTQQGNNVTVYYSEVHTVTTNALGLFSITIGGGKVDKGTFASIPWSTADIWMQVAIKDKGKADFVTVSNSKLLAVPYAFHSETANTLVGVTPAIDPGVTQVASVFSETSTCSCQEGLNSLKLLYVGSSNVDIKVFEDAQLRKLIATLSKIQNGDIVTVSASSPRKSLPDEIYFQIQNSSIPVLEMPSGCKDAIVGETFGNFSVISRTDSRNGSVCSVCDIKQNWKIGGNVVADPCNWLGTKSKSDLVIITDNTDRVRITADGNVNISNTLNVGKNLNVTGAANLQNTLDVAGATHLKNTLVTDGITTITNNTQSNSPSDGSLVTTGGAGIGGNLNVGGKVNFGGASAFGGQLHITDLTQSTSPITGALIVDGGTGIGKNLNVGGTTNLSGATTLHSTLDVTDSTHLKNTLITDGATNINNSLTVTKNDPNFVATIINTNDGEGDGLKIKLGRTKSSYTIPAAPTFDATQVQQFKDLLRCDFTGDRVSILGNIVLNDLEETGKVLAGVAVGAGNMIINVINSGLGLPLSIPDITVPAIHLSDPIDVTGPINSGLHLPIVLPALTVPAVQFPKLAVPDIVIHTPDPLPNITLPGFTVTNAFQLTPAIPLIGATTVMPTLPDLTIPALDIPRTTLLTGRTVMPRLPQIDLTSIGIPSIDITSLSFWGLDFNLCLTDAAGTSPLNNSNEFIRFADKEDNKVGSIRGESVTNWAANYLNPAFLSKLRGALLSSKMDKFHAQYHFKNEITTALASYAKIGVEYTSGNGDYAEWLERSDKKEFINPGDIVAVKGGKITKDLMDAEQVMVVSHNPIMLGNVPTEEKNYQGNNIAFIGQVPVKILGPVVSGDYIIGHNNTPGYGIAKHPTKMTVEDYKLAVGRSWETDESQGIKLVNTVVGLHNNNFLSLIKDLKEKEEKNDVRLKALEAKLNMIVPVKSKVFEKKQLN